MAIPMLLYLLNFFEKRRMPDIKVKSGVREFNAPAVELCMCVIAIAKQYAGIKLPSNPANANHFMSFLSTNLIPCMPNGKNSKPTKLNLKEANWVGVKYFKPSCISINELPQITDNEINNNHPNDLFSFDIIA